MKVTYGTIQDKEYNFSATPESHYRQYKRRKKMQEPNWVAPEHQRAASYMERAYPVDHAGRKMVELGKELVLEQRPQIMQPKREVFSLGISE